MKQYKYISYIFAKSDCFLLMYFVLLKFFYSITTKIITKPTYY